MASSSSSFSWRQQAPYNQEYEDAQQKQCHKIESSSLSSVPTYPASCYCGRVKYEVRGEPESSKFCHCRGCQQLHGAPFEWVCVFHKHNVKFDPKSLDFLYFYSDGLDQGWDSTTAQDRTLPVKVSCSHCRTPIADEGRHMWLAFATLFGFTVEGITSNNRISSGRDGDDKNTIPPSFRHTDHLFYGQRCVDLGAADQQKKWVGHRNRSHPWKQND